MAKEQTKFNTDNIRFDIINENKVKKLKKRISEASDEEWVTKQLNSKLLKGITNGDDIKTIASSFVAVVGNSTTSAMRNARTMFTEAENVGRLDSYKNLSSQGVVMKKEWIATPDDRTRESHIEIDGEEVEIDEDFSTGCADPADPKGDGSETWNWRCGMGTHIVGFKKSDGSISYVKGTRATTTHSTQMSEEKTRRAEKKATKTK